VVALWSSKDVSAAKKSDLTVSVIDWMCNNRVAAYWGMFSATKGLIALMRAAGSTRKVGEGAIAANPLQTEAVDWVERYLSRENNKPAHVSAIRVAIRRSHDSGTSQ
jgi:hypothetical protein